MGGKETTEGRRSLGLRSKRGSPGEATLLQGEPVKGGDTPVAVILNVGEANLTSSCGNVSDNRLDLRVSPGGLDGSID